MLSNGSEHLRIVIHGIKIAFLSIKLQKIAQRLEALPPDPQSLWQLEALPPDSRL